MGFDWAQTKDKPSNVKLKFSRKVRTRIVRDNGDSSLFVSFKFMFYRQLQRLNYRWVKVFYFDSFLEVPFRPVAASHTCAPAIDKSTFVISEAVSEDELWAAACLRVRTFNELTPSAYNAQEHRRYLAEREFEAVKERISGKREGFTRVSCINATLPLSQLSSSSEDLCSACKFSDGIEDRVVVGSLDLNQCRWLPDEIAGTKPMGIGEDFARAYISNFCVAKELHRNGVGYKLIKKAKGVGREWGITDMYVHVTVDNEAAKRLYMKSGFEQETAEPAWQARYLNRPQRLLLWLALSTSSIMSM